MTRTRHFPVLSFKIVLAFLLVLCQPGWLAAQCQALVRLPGNGGLWIATSTGILVRRLTSEWVSLAAWSPDGQYVACAYSVSDTGLITRDGRLLSRRKENSDLVSVWPTGIGWAGPEILWLRDSGHASSEITFWRLSQEHDLNRVEVLGQVIGDECAISPDSKTIACIEAGHVHVVEAGHDALADAKIIYPASFLEPGDQRGSVDISLGQVVRTHTDPAFQVQVSPQLPPAIAQGSVLLNVTPPDGHTKSAYLRTDGDWLGVDLGDADWRFVLQSLDSRRSRFRITMYRDDSKRELSGIAWDREGSRLLTWETTRHGRGLLLLARTGMTWSPVRIRVELASEQISARRFDSDGKAAIVESPSTVYRCGLDSHAVCRSAASQPPPRLDVRRDGYIVPTEVLDWHCVPGRN